MHPRDRYSILKIRLDPQRASRYCQRADAWVAKGDVERAIGDYTEALWLDPRYVPAHLGRGSAWGSKGEYDKAIDDFNEAIRLDPRFPGAYTMRGQAWHAKDDHRLAIADLDEAIRLDPTDSLAYFLRGSSRYELDEDEKAIADYDEAIRLDPEYADAYEWRAWIWATCPDGRLRDGPRAVASATRACELTEWKEPGALSTLAAAYAEVGDFDAAIKWEETAQPLYDDDEERDEGRERLELYREKKPYREGPETS